jgi:cytochrome c peroxidase
LYQKSETEILGVLENPNAAIKKIDEDLGRYNNNVLSEHSWIYERSFKTSSLRNVNLTAPYFHNGAYSTLKEVVDFYNSGGGIGLGFEVANQTLGADSLGLSEVEIDAIIKFMESLTDASYLNIE